MSETVQPWGFWELADAHYGGGEGGWSRNVNKDCIKAEASSFFLSFSFAVVMCRRDFILAFFLESAYSLKLPPDFNVFIKNEEIFLFILIQGDLHKSFIVFATVLISSFFLS